MNPPLFVVKGDASPEEVAALVVVLQALAAAGATGSSEPPPRAEWSAPRRLIAGATPRPGPGAWRSTSLPR